MHKVRQTIVNINVVDLASLHCPLHLRNPLPLEGAFPHNYLSGCGYGSASWKDIAMKLHKVRQTIINNIYFSFCLMISYT